MPSIKRLLLLVLCLSLAGPLAANEARYKASFVYKMLDFAQWPARQETTLRLCTVSSDAQWSAFQALNGKRVGARVLKARRLVRGSSVKGCGVVYLGEMSVSELKDWASSIDDEPLLSVCDGWHCARDGVMVGLGMEDRRLFFEFNSAVMARSEVKLGSRFLRLARTVY